MNKELLFSFQELLSVLIDQPSNWSQRVADISSLLRQMHHLLNMLRPHQVSPMLLCCTSKRSMSREVTAECCSQAWATLAHSLQTETQQRHKAVADLQTQVANAQRYLEACAAPIKPGVGD